MSSVSYEICPASAPFFGFAGVSAALCLSCLGASYGTAKAGVGISSMGVMNPGAVIKNVLPVILAGILGIYGLYVSFSGLLEARILSYVVHENRF